MKEACEIFKAVSDPTRLRVFKVLLVAKAPLCGSDLVKILKVRHYNLSRHLKILKIAGLLEERKEGRFVYHSLKKHNENFYKFFTKTIESIET